MSFDVTTAPENEAQQASQSLWNRAMSFDYFPEELKSPRAVSIPLEQGNVFRQHSRIGSRNNVSQSLWNRAMSFNFERNQMSVKRAESQSLWNRAMSFDKDGTFARLSGSMSQSLWNRAMSFDQLNVSKVNYLSICLNPFGTGQCLSTSFITCYYC